MSVDHDSPEPLYEQLAAILRGQIEAGELTGRVPSAKTLSQRYGVSVGTAERALGILRDAALIRSAIGRGHFVVRPRHNPGRVPAWRAARRNAHAALRPLRARNQESDTLTPLTPNRGVSR